MQRALLEFGFGRSGRIFNRRALPQALIISAHQLCVAPRHRIAIKRRYLAGIAPRQFFRDALANFHERS